MTCSSTVLKYPLVFLVQTTAAYILMYCNSFLTTFTAVRGFQLTKKELRLDASAYQSSDRPVQHLCLWLQNEPERQLCGEFAPQPGGTSDNDALAEQNIIIKKKIPIHWRKEWQKFRSCKFIQGQYFCDNFILHCDFIRFTGIVIIVVRPPWVRCEFLAALPLLLIF